MPVSNILKEKSLWDLFPKCKGAFSLKREKTTGFIPSHDWSISCSDSQGITMMKLTETLYKTLAGCRFLSIEPRKLILVT